MGRQKKSMGDQKRDAQDAMKAYEQSKIGADYSICPPWETEEEHAAKWANPEDQAREKLAQQRRARLYESTDQIKRMVRNQWWTNERIAKEFDVTEEDIIRFIKMNPID